MPTVGQPARHIPCVAGSLGPLHSTRCKDPTNRTHIDYTVGQRHGRNDDRCTPRFSASSRAQHDARADARVLREAIGSVAPQHQPAPAASVAALLRVQLERRQHPRRFGGSLEGAVVPTVVAALWAGGRARGLPFRTAGGRVEFDKGGCFRRPVQSGFGEAAELVLRLRCKQGPTTLLPHARSV